MAPPVAHNALLTDTIGGGHQRTESNDSQTTLVGDSVLAVTNVEDEQYSLARATSDNKDGVLEAQRFRVTAEPATEPAWTKAESPTAVAPPTDSANTTAALAVVDKSVDVDSGPYEVQVTGIADGIPVAVRDGDKTSRGDAVVLTTGTSSTSAFAMSNDAATAAAATAASLTAGLFASLPYAFTASIDTDAIRFGTSIAGMRSFPPQSLNGPGSSANVQLGMGINHAYKYTEYKYTAVAARAPAPSSFLPQPGHTAPEPPRALPGHAAPEPPRPRTEYQEARSVQYYCKTCACRHGGDDWFCTDGDEDEDWSSSDEENWFSSDDEDEDEDEAENDEEVENDDEALEAEQEEDREPFPQMPTWSTGRPLERGDGTVTGIDEEAGDADDVTSDVGEA
ncbi:hypothetical protein AURDEDRAFT_184380 [Auricularia subglabra TFB-10046 SS5]|nr:hypothetical protein AURDEDRAFT_184380 [Auricularia subglabra TFB-10046 SS5]